VLLRKRLWIACFCAHFLIILAVCCRDTFSFVGRGYTVLPTSVAAYAQKAEWVFSSALGEHLGHAHPFRHLIAVYTHCAGIEASYGFFAPNVPDNYKLVFEIHYPDGRVDYDLPHASNAGAGLRLATLIENIGETRYDPLREVMVKMVAYSVWRDHPEATMIRAVLGFVILPTLDEYRRGKREQYEFLYAYDFRFLSSDAVESH
jgi:hypothetical protein